MTDIKAAMQILIAKWNAACRAHDAGADSSRARGLALAANILDGEAAGFRRCAADLSALLTEYDATNEPNPGDQRAP